MIQSKKIKLRAPELIDVDKLYSWENNQSLWYLSNTVTPFSKFTLEQYILNSHQDIYTAKQLRLMIDLADDTTIGTIDLYEFDPINLHAGIGILINEKYQQKGYASDALTVLIDYAFNTLKLHQLHCGITSNNEASIKLFSKLGFQLIGIRKQWIRYNQTWLDEHLYQLINPV